jgi:hypothetical protein
MDHRFDGNSELQLAFQVRFAAANRLYAADVEHMHWSTPVYCGYVQFAIRCDVVRKEKIDFQLRPNRI